MATRGITATQQKWPFDKVPYDGFPETSGSILHGPHLSHLKREKALIRPVCSGHCLRCKVTHKLGGVQAGAGRYGQKTSIHLRVY